MCGPYWCISTPAASRMVVGVAADVRAPVDQQHPLAELRGQPLGQHRAGEARADDQVVVGLASAGGRIAGARRAADRRRGRRAWRGDRRVDQRRPSRAKVLSHDRAAAPRRPSASQAPAVGGQRQRRVAAGDERRVASRRSSRLAGRRSGAPRRRSAVETTGRPPARYSGVLVGLMKRVASLMAKGISATSQPAR